MLTSDAVVLFYCANWVKTFWADVVPELGHTWSLAVEEQFYLVWPWLVALAVRLGLSPRRIALWLMGGIAASATVRAIVWSQAAGNYEHVWFRTDARADTLLVGALLSLAWREGWLGRIRWFGSIRVTALAVIAVVALRLGLAHNWLMYGGCTLVAVSAAVLIASVLDRSPWRHPVLATWLRRRVVTHFGAISYGLYLRPVPAYIFVAWYGNWLGRWKPAAALILAVSLAELSMAVIERPFLRLKSRLDNRVPAATAQRVNGAIAL